MGDIFGWLPPRRPPLTKVNGTSGATMRKVERPLILVGRIKAETSKAICLGVRGWKDSPSDDPDDEEIESLNSADNFTPFDKTQFKDEWFPLSQVTKIFRGSAMNQTLDELHVSRWIAKQKGLL